VRIVVIGISYCTVFRIYLLSPTLLEHLHILLSIYISKIEVYLSLGLHKITVWL